MMVGTASTVWKNHPDFVSFDRSGDAVVDTPGERLSLDLASAEAREYYSSNILATVKNMQLPGVSSSSPHPHLILTSSSPHPDILSSSSPHPHLILTSSALPHLILTSSSSAHPQYMAG